MPLRIKVYNYSKTTLQDSDVYTNLKGMEMDVSKAINGRPSQPKE